MFNIAIALKNAGGAVLHSVEGPFSAGEDIEKLLATAVKDAPEIKTAALKLVELVEGVGSDAATDISAKGLNIPSDVKTFQDAVGVYTYVRTELVPLFKSVYGDVKADFEPSADTAATGEAAQSGPGLHNTVAA